jgi:hypothetical protein
LESEERRKRETAKNSLETYCYAVKDIVDVEKEDVMAVSTEEQRQETFDMVETMEEWLYDEGDSVVYKEKQAEISMKVDVIKFRVPEISLRDNAVAEACKVLNATTEVED